MTRRDFTAVKAVNTVWLTDITEHKTGAGKLYLCAIKDACSGRVVGYSIDTRMKSKLPVAALSSAVARRGRWGVSVPAAITLRWNPVMLSIIAVEFLSHMPRPLIPVVQETFRAVRKGLRDAARGWASHGGFIDAQDRHAHYCSRGYDGSDAACVRFDT